MKTHNLNDFVESKQRTLVDIRQEGPIVSDREEFALSTDGQENITLTKFGINADLKQNYLVIVDGKILQEGSSKDYTLSSLSNNEYFQVDFTTPLGAGLTIEVRKLGVQQAQLPNPSSVQATLNNDVKQPHKMALAGFNAFIDGSEELTPINGAPGTGQYRSEITNRAPIRDDENTLKSSLGIERVMFNSLVNVVDESGPSGEPIFKLNNDERIRFFGSVSAETSFGGTGIGFGVSFTSGSIEGIEVVFYGTGLNLLGGTLVSGRTFDAEVDGGLSFSVDFSGSGILQGRGYRANHVVNVISGLTLGWHTVKLTIGSSGSLPLQGLEILNESTQIVTNLGTAYYGTKEDLLDTQSLTNYNVGVVGTRGARVVKYLKDGSVSQAVQEVNVSQGNLGSADHTNEEIIRKINWREFGANRGDDFSTLTITGSDRAFTLDDGTTTLVGNDTRSRDVGDEDTLTFADGTGDDFLTITFVGTGLDILWVPNVTGTNTAAPSFEVDGANIGSLDNTQNNTNPRVKKIVSGLPYGTHTVKINVETSNVWAINIIDFLIYGPKKPSLPAGAIELADYNVMADFSANAAAGLETIATGVLRKDNTREFIYEGTWNLSSDVTFIGGFNANSNANGDSFKYTFFGTGFELRWSTESNRSADVTVDIDGSTDHSSLTTSTYGTGINFTASTGTLDMVDSTTQQGVGLSISGLPLGLHTVTITNNTTDFIVVDALDIITPIHINNTKVGSLALKDTRRFSPIEQETKEELDLGKAKAWLSFDGTNNEIIESYNISAVIDAGTGDYRISFEKPFKNSSYVATSTCEGSGSNLGIYGLNPTPHNYRILTRRTDTLVLEDTQRLSIAWFGELEGEGEG